MGQTWVVYRRPMADDPFGSVGVCTQAEWAALDRTAPGVLVLVRAGLPSEAEAERAGRQEVARRPPGADTGKRPPRPPLVTGPPGDEE